MVNLHTDYFKQIHTHNFDKFKYTAFQPVHNALVLFSESGVPLASLQLNCINNNFENIKSILTKRPESINSQCDFQGIITDEDKEFELIITNLTSLGHINFNIFLQDSKTLKVNHSAINQINVLNSFKSVSVKSDQNKSNGALILKAIKKMNQEQKVTVTEAETVTGEKSESTYLYLSVVPEANKQELINLFKKTVWKCVDVLIFKEQINNPMNTESVGISGRYTFDYNTVGSSLKNASYDLKGAQTNPKYIVSPWLDSNIEPNIERRAELLNQQVRVTPGLNLPVTHDLCGPLEKTIDNSKVSTDKNNRRRIIPSIAEREPIVFSDMMNNLGVWRAPAIYGDIDAPTTNRSYYSSATFNPKINDNEHNKTYAFDYSSDIIDPTIKDMTNQNYNYPDPTNMEFQNKMYTKRDFYTRSMPERKYKPNLNNANDIIGGSYAGQITTGRKIEVRSTPSEIEFDYDVPAANCNIGLSISKDIEFREINADIYISEAKEQIEDIIKNESKILLESLSRVFKSDQCCVCLDEEDKNLNVIFYSCGHQCCHKACVINMNKCPLCRTLITAQIDIALDNINIISMEEFVSVDHENDILLDSFLMQSTSVVN